MQIEIYSDVVCPWCYVGERRFFAALESMPELGDVEVVFRPYQLDPAAPAQATPLLPSLERKFGGRAADIVRQVTDAAEGAGVSLRFDRALAANTFDAHRLLWLAAREGGPAVQRALAERLFAAHFTEGGDIGDPTQLAAHAAAAGLDPERAAAFLASDGGTAELRRRARRRPRARRHRGPHVRLRRPLGRLRRAARGGVPAGAGAGPPAARHHNARGEICVNLRTSADEYSSKGNPQMTQMYADVLRRRSICEICEIGG